MATDSKGGTLVIYGGVNRCSPEFNVTDQDNYFSGVFANELVPYLQRYSFLDRSGINHVSQMNSFGATYNSGLSLGSHFFLCEGSGTVIRSHDLKYSGVVRASLGTVTEPVWLFNNSKIAGQRISISGGANPENFEHTIKMPQFDGLTFVGEGGPSSGTFTITFDTTHGGFPNGGGETNFIFVHGPSGYEQTPSVTTDVTNGTSLNSLATTMISYFNTVGPWVSNPISIISTAPYTMTFFVSGASNLPDSILGGAAYEHYTTGAEDGPYGDDFEWSSEFYGGDTLVLSGAYDYAPLEYSYPLAYHNGNCLRLGMYNASGNLFPNDADNYYEATSATYLSGTYPLPSGNFSMALLYNDFSNSAYFLSNFERIFPLDENGRFFSTATFGDSSVEVMTSGSLDTYPNFTHSIKYRSSSGIWNISSGYYSMTNVNNRFIGQVLSYSGGHYSLSVVTTSGTLRQVLTSSQTTRYPSGHYFYVKPNCSWGLRELIINSGDVIQNNTLETYLRNPVNRISSNTTVANYSGLSPCVLHRGPNVVNRLYSGDIVYAIGDTLLTNPSGDSFYSIPSGSDLTLDMVVQYSGTANCYLSPWISMNREGSQYTWTPASLAYGAPLPNSRGIRILPDSGIHKVTFRGEHKVDSSGALYNAALLYSLSYQDSATSYSGGDFRLFAAHLYSDEGLCLANVNRTHNMDLYIGGVYPASSGMTLFVSGAPAAPSGNIPLYICGPLPDSGGFPLVMSGAIFHSSGTTLYISGIDHSENSFPLYLHNEMSSGDSSIPLVTFSYTASGIFKSLDLFVHAAEINKAFPLYVKNGDTEGSPSGYIPLFLDGGDNVARKSVNLYVESVRQSSGDFRLYIAGEGLTAGAIWSGYSAPLYLHNTDVLISSGDGLSTWNPLLTAVGFLGFVPDISGNLSKVNYMPLFISGPVPIESGMPLSMRVEDISISDLTLYTFGF